MNANALHNILYPNCLCDNWQMHESERRALTAILHRLMPRCAIEIGTYRGGSLSLISQYAESVFSIDIDPEPASRYSGFKNVSFLTGPSQHLRPLLLKELDDKEMSPGFIFVDGDHSAEGVKRDIDCLLACVPRVPLFLALHDSFNPGCRAGMLSARWEASKHVHWVDLDFVPGRMNEHGGGGDGEMWGGVALAYFHPEPRTGPLVVSTTSQRTFAIINAHVTAEGKLPQSSASSRQNAATVP